MYVVCVCKSELKWGVFLNFLHLTFWDRYSHLCQELINSVKLIGPQAPGICLHLPRWEFPTHTLDICNVGYGEQAQVLVFVQKALYWLDYRPSSKGQMTFLGKQNAQKNNFGGIIWFG